MNKIITFINSLIYITYLKLFFRKKIQISYFKVWFEPFSRVVIEESKGVVSAKIIFEDKAYIRSYTELRSIGGTLKIGKKVYFNRFCQVSCRKSIVIGNSCQFGERCSIYDNDHVSPSDVNILSEGKFITDKVLLKENTWVGAGSFIVKGVETGKNCTVGANTFVKKRKYSDNSLIINE